MKFLTTIEVTRLLGVTESSLRHALRRAGAPRPFLHGRAFLWTPADVERMARFMGIALAAEVAS